MVVGDRADAFCAQSLVEADRCPILLHDIESDCPSASAWSTAGCAHPYVAQQPEAAVSVLCPGEGTRGELPLVTGRPDAAPRSLHAAAETFFRQVRIDTCSACFVLRSRTLSTRT